MLFDKIEPVSDNTSHFRLLERRGSQRVAVEGSLHVEVVDLKMHLRLVDVSRGGCLTVSPVAVRQGAVMHLKITTAAGERLLLDGQARAVHVRPLYSWVGERSERLVGFEWVPADDAGWRQNVGALVERMEVNIRTMSEDPEAQGVMHFSTPPAWEIAAVG